MDVNVQLSNFEKQKQNKYPTPKQKKKTKQNKKEDYTHITKRHENVHMYFKSSLST